MTRSPRVVPAALAALVALLLAACAGGNSGVPQCEDDYDNDGDGLIDEDDPACAAGASSESQDPPAACEDGADNDGDGKVDFPADPGCTSPDDGDEYSVEAPDCMNGRDDDGDGKIDFPADPGCRAANQMNEGDDCPDGPLCPECGNGRDDDFDGQTDFPGDPGCTTASGAFEYNLDPNACGAGTMVTELPSTFPVTGTIGGSPSNVTPAMCTGATGAGAETAYAFLVEEPTVLVATTNLGGTSLDTVLYVRRACRMAGTELACADDVSPTVNRSTLTVALQPGAYYLVVDGKVAGQAGNYQLDVDFYRGEGQTCAGAGQCAPGYECRTPAGGSGTSCERPVCGDGRDDDGDGKIDFPNDPGCTSATDATETDTCPGAGCPACGDGVDNDGDGRTDYPMDTACASASGPTELACTSADPVQIFTADVSNRPTGPLANDLALSCAGTANGRDDVYLLRVTRPLSELTIDTVGSVVDTALALRQASCSSFDLQCDDNAAGNGDSRIYLIDVNPGEYYIVVDDKNTSGVYNLNVRGVIASGAACDPTSTVFTCASGYACAGAAGAETCTPAACNDTVDQDGDGRTGYPNDPGCASPSDATETDDCPGGPGCPACSNTRDDDGDTFIDFGGDPGCVAASSTSELAPCTSTDPVVALTQSSLANVATIGSRSNDVDLSCGADGRDEIYRLMVSRPLATLTIDTVGSALDTVLAVRGTTCNGTSDLACDDDGAGNLDSRVTLTNVGVGEYFVIVDDRNATNPGTYNLNVAGTITPGGACDPASTQFTCTAGHACTGAAGMTTCTPAACNDMADQDGDGRVGFPTDPGCTSISDDDEADDCPSGPMCPACSNQLDDDQDGFTDYPADPACAAAGVNSELAPCTSTDTVPVLTGNLAGQTTMGRANDVDLSCGADGRDMIYRYYVTQPLVSLTVDTFGSDTNTAVALRRGTCNGTTDLACGTNNFGTNDARATLTTVTPGEYFVVVDDLNVATPTTFNLNLSGVIAGGGRCTPGSTAFTCQIGFTCAGTAGAEVCAPTACNDMIDQDGDGRIGYPTDPGCTGVADTDEADACPSGPGCPQCADGIDNDGDMLVDFPADTGCLAASSNLEISCATEADPITAVTMPTYTGNTTGAANNFLPSCRASNSVAPDRVYLLQLPVPVASLRIDTIESDLDTTIILKTAACEMSELGCNDDSGGSLDSLLTLTNLVAGGYAIIVDGASSGSAGAYTLNVRGTVAAGTACTDPLFTTGVLACAAGTTCQQGTCQ